ncbi:ABC transporter permease [bacterium]|jgi:phospholipid/cholesterol/gamma-HCH transport system permease protein|nr:ABC transporter permease [bacterium]MBT3903265.1 ABC transporter permease [bacterium]MBT4577757.1 ABC transporter permease [bacterium]MBT5345917.1 ABC transporter permease [bacterium]MBT6131303.1 ABC transporter permease [bacterium]
MVAWLVSQIGHHAVQACNLIGDFALFLIRALLTLFTTKLKVSKLLNQMERIGVNSLLIVVLTGTFTGMVLALQSHIGFSRFGAEEFIGTVVALSMTRELGPVLTGLMVTGRAGSSIAAELGTMRITEQIDALKTLRIDTFQYLVVPRLLASIIVLPFLSLLSTLCGIIGGYVISVNVLGLNGDDYTSGISEYLELSDITGGLVKAAVFGLILAWVGAYKGYRTTGGARGVGLSTTKSVVLASIFILISNYFLATALF